MIKLAIDNSCIQCGHCVDVCPARILTQEETKGDIRVVNLQTCIRCGHCVAICPTESVLHSAFPAGTVHKVNKDIVPSADALLELLRKRRSNRAFSEKPVPSNLLDKILEAAHLAPTGGNWQKLEYTVITKAKVLEAVHKATIAVCDKAVESMKQSDDAQTRLQSSYFESLSNKYKGGYEGVLRGATAIIMIHSDYSGALLDANLAYQNASLMAETLGIAHFYTGYVRIFASLDSEKTIASTMGITNTIYAGMALAMPRYGFNKYVERDPQVVHRIE